MQLLVGNTNHYKKLTKMKINSKCHLLASSLLITLLANLNAYSQEISTRLVEQLNQSYLSIGNSLARAELAEARSAANKYLQMLKTQDTGDLERLAQTAQGIVNATTLTQARQRFDQLARASEQLKQKASTNQKIQTTEDKSDREILMLQENPAIEEAKKYRRGNHLPYYPGGHMHNHRR